MHKLFHPHPPFPVPAIQLISGNLFGMGKDVATFLLSSWENLQYPKIKSMNYKPKHSQQILLQYVMNA